MKKNRIIAGLSAIMMGATMMASTAMSASAKTVYDTSGAVVGDGGFYTYYDSDGDGTSEWAQAPNRHGIRMYDALIANAIENSDDTYTLTLQSVTVAGIASGSISKISVTTNGDNLISNNQVTLDADTTYYMTLSVTALGFIPIPHGSDPMEIQFRVTE